MDTILSKAARRFSTAVNGIAIAANIAGTLVVLSLVAIVNFDVFARGLFNLPFRGAVEVVQFSMVLIVFLQLPDVVRVNRLTRSEGLILMLGDRYPGLARALRRAVNMLSFVVMGLIAVSIWPEFVKMWDSDDFFGIPGVFTAPWWPIKLTIFLSTALCAVIFMMKVLRSSGSDQPQ